MADRWVAKQNSDPIRRIAFGSQAAAEAFVAELIGWSVISSDDEDWLPMVGGADGPVTYQQRQ